MLPLFGEVGPTWVGVCCRCWVKTDLWVSLPIFDVWVSRAQRICLLPPQGELGPVGFIMCCHYQEKLGLWGIFIIFTRKSQPRGGIIVYCVAALLYYNAYNIPSINQATNVSISNLISYISKIQGEIVNEKKLNCKQQKFILVHTKHQSLGK